MVHTCSGPAAILHMLMLAQTNVGEVFFYSQPSPEDGDEVDDGTSLPRRWLFTRDLKRSRLNIL